jgi:hypothetical protein
MISLHHVLGNDGKAQSEAIDFAPVFAVVAGAFLAAGHVEILL